MSLPLDYVVMEIFVLIMIGIIGSTICEKIGYSKEPKSLTGGITKGK